MCQKPIKDTMPRTISFRSRSSGREEGDEAIMFDDDTGLVGVESQVHRPPSEMKKKNSFSFFSKSQARSQVTSEIKSKIGGEPLEMKRLQLERLKEGNCLRKFAGKTLERQQSRQRPRQQSSQGVLETDNNSTMKKGFGLFRSLSRNRSRAKSVNARESPPNIGMSGLQKDDDNINGKTFTAERSHFDEEASGLTPPNFYVERSSSVAKERPHPSQIRTQSPHPRSSSRSKNMQSRNKTSNHRTTSQPRNLNVPPRSNSSRPMQVGSANRSNKSLERQQMSNSRGRERVPSRGSEWVSRSTSKGRSRGNRNCSLDKSPQRLNKVQDVQRKSQGREHSYEYGRQQQQPSTKTRSNSANRSYRQGQSQSRDRGQELENEYREFNNHAMSQKSHKESIQSRRSQYDSVHQIKSVANKGNSGTLGMLALNMSSSDDSDYFVK